jgi:hypothetical protein
MGFVLHLGVVDVPYQAGGETTGDVAEILEAHYHLIEVFTEELGLDLISSAVGHAVDNSIRDMFSGAPAAGAHPAQDAFGEIEASFRLAIDQREFDGIIPGVPTGAALRGVNHRFKRPYLKTNPERPSFRDTGLYQASFKVWGD